METGGLAKATRKSLPSLFPSAGFVFAAVMFVSVGPRWPCGAAGWGWGGHLADGRIRPALGSSRAELLSSGYGGPQLWVRDIDELRSPVRLWWCGNRIGKYIVRALEKSPFSDESCPLAVPRAAKTVMLG